MKHPSLPLRYKLNGIVSDLNFTICLCAALRLLHYCSPLYPPPIASSRTRLQTGWNNDNSHCTAYLLRHLRKVLLMSAISHNEDAVRACMHLAKIPFPASPPPAKRIRRNTWSRYSADEIRPDTLRMKAGDSTMTMGWRHRAKGIVK